MPREPLVIVTMSSRDFSQYVLWRDMYIGLHRGGIIAVSIDTSVGSLPLAELVEKACGLVISGGGDLDPHLYGGDSGDPTLYGVDTQRDTNEIDLFNLAVDKGIPILGICRGAQLINVARGGTLYVDVRRDYGEGAEHVGPEERLDEAVHSVSVEEGTRLASLLGVSGSIEVNSGHHQGIARVGDHLRTVATASDGLVEGIEGSFDNELIVGVQWHPENLWRTQIHAQRLLREFGVWCS